MIFRHKHLSDKFLDNKSIHKITQDKPLVVLLSTKFIFLNDFIIYSLKLNRIPFEVKETSEQQVMSHRLPVIAFKNYFLSQQTLVEFIGDLMLSRQTLVDLTERKTLAKDFYRKWIDVIKQENTGLCNYSNLRHLGVLTEQDYFNHLGSLYFAMASYIKSNILEAKYEGYRRNEINIETLMIYDIIKSILKLCQKTKADHILRGNFESLIDFHEEFKRRIEMVLNAERQEAPLNEIEVVTQKVQEAPIIQYAKFSQNWKRFTIAFTVAAAIYVKWVQ